MHYNVLTEPWIPARLPDGSVREYGVLDLLEHANELIEITDAMPNYEYGIYRFLFAFLMDAFHPKRQREIRILLERGSFDMDVIRAYTEECNRNGERFDLLDEKHPFFQQIEKYDKEENANSPAKLNPVFPCGNNHVHFDHHFENNVTLTLAEAARALVALNVFSASGGKGYQPAISSSSGSVPVYSIVMGGNLFETLIFGMMPIEAEDYNETSAPIWRKTVNLCDEYSHAKLPLLFGLTYPVRAVRLFERNGLIDRVFYSPGLKYSKERTIWNDPYVSYKFNTKKGKYEALCGDETHDLWRDIGVLFDCLKKTANGDAHCPTAPAIVCQFLEYDKPLVHVNTYTILNDRATYKKMSKDEYIFSSDVLKDAIRYDFLVNVGLAEIEKEGNQLHEEIHRVRNAVLKVKREKESRKRKSPAIDSESYRTMNRYFSSARREFFEYLYPKLSVISVSEMSELQNNWGVILRQIRREEYDEFIGRLSDSSYLLLLAEKAKSD